MRELPCAGGDRVLYRVTPDTARDETAGDMRVLRVFGPGQSRIRPWPGWRRRLIRIKADHDFLG